MKTQTRNLLTVLVGAGALSLLGTTSSFALGMPDPLHYDMGPLGQWSVTGELSGFGAFWNNNVPTTPNTGEGSLNGDVSIENAIFILNKTDGQLQFTVWAGVPPNTPVLGFNSPNVGPSLSALGGDFARNEFHRASPLFKGFATYAPDALPWFSAQVGRLPSPDGTEIGVDMFNPTPFVSDLNNMQTTTADGGQVNFIAGGDKAFYYGFVPGYGSTLTIRLADGYKTGHANELGFTGLWNLNPAATDYVVAFGHTRLSPALINNVGDAGNNSGHNFSAVAGFGVVNSDLIGIGGQYVTGPWTFIPQMQYQWLPNNIKTGGPKVLNNYSEASAEITTMYQIDQNWSLNGIVQFIAQNAGQHNGANDPNANNFGNYLGLNSGGVGTFGPGSDMMTLEFNPTWQFHNFFVRPSVEWTHLSAFNHGGCTAGSPGQGYGAVGCDDNQFVGLVEIGFLLGQFAD